MKIMHINMHAIMTTMHTKKGEKDEEDGMTYF